MAARYGLRRYYRPRLEKSAVGSFFAEFDKYWNGVVRSFGPAHPFWRNPVSSKMQEWERSAGEFALTLFTLARTPLGSPLDLIVICDGVQEADTWKAWGSRQGWEIRTRCHVPGGAAVRRLGQEFTNALRFFYALGVACRHKWRARRAARSAGPGGPQVLIASGFYPESFHGGQYRDPFFGRLHTVVSPRCGEVLYLNLPLSGVESAGGGGEVGEVSVHLPHMYVGWAELLLVAARVFLRRLPIAGARFMECDLTRLLKWHARRFVGFFSLEAELYYAAVRRLCRRYRFKRLICNFEGNVFERGCIQGFRESGGARVAGYSQGVVFPANLKLRLSEAEAAVRPEPDLYVCSGPYAMELLAQVGGRDRSRMVSGCALRAVPRPEPREERSGSGKPGWILVALDGVWGTVSVLDWIFEHAEVFGGRRVRIRAHPNVPLSRLLERTVVPKPEDFEASDGDLRSDIKGALCVLYRQTSVGMQALRIGVPAVHLAVDSPLPCDPIEELTAGKWMARDAAELRDVLDRIETHTAGPTTADMERARLFAENYFAEPTAAAMADFCR